MQYKASERTLPVVLPGFRCHDDAVLHEFGMHQIRQELWAWMSARAYACNDDRIEKLLTFLFREWVFVVALVNEFAFSSAFWS